MIKVTTGDTQPLLTLTLYSDTAKTTALDLTTASTITWHFLQGSTDITKTATIADAATGVTTFQWDGDPLITPGQWYIRAVITWTDTSIETTAAGIGVEIMAAA